MTNLFPPTLVKRPVLHEGHYSQRREKDAGRPDDPFTEPVTQSFDLYTTDAPVEGFGIEYYITQIRKHEPESEQVTLYCFVTP